MRIFDWIKTNLRTLLIVLAPIVAVVCFFTAFSGFNSLFAPPSIELGPTPTLLSNWSRFIENDFQIQLPNSYIGTEEIDSIPLLREKYVGTDLADRFRFYASEKDDAFDLLYVELELFSFHSLSNYGETARNIGERTVEEMEPGFHVIEHGPFEAEVDSYYIYYEFSIPEQEGRIAAIQYIYQHQEGFWFLVVKCHPDFIPLKRQEFDQIASSFVPLGEYR